MSWKENAASSQNVGTNTQRRDAKAQTDEDLNGTATKA